MNEFFRLLVDRLLSWPVAVFGVCLIFHSSIRMLLSELTAFIARASRISLKHNETAVEAITEAKLQVEKGAKEAESDLGVGMAISLRRASISEDLSLEQTAVRDYGKGIQSVLTQENSIKAELGRLGFGPENPETIDVVVRQLAAQQCVSFFERTYRLIYGSQLSALDFINTSGPTPANVLEMLFYDIARNVEESFYSDFSFEQWLSFLFEKMLVVQESENLRISVAGRDFLVWMVNAGLSHYKPH